MATEFKEFPQPRNEDASKLPPLLLPYFVSMILLGVDSFPWTGTPWMFGLAEEAEKEGSTVTRRTQPWWRSIFRRRRECV